MSYLCGRCFSTLNELSPYIQHDCEHSFNTDQIPCGQCPYLCHSIKSFLVHRKHFCSATQNLPNFNCPTCFLAFASQHQYTQHVENAHKTQYSIFPTRALLKSAARNDETSSSDEDEFQCAQGYHPCELCEFVGSSKRSLRDHYKQHYSSSSDDSDREMSSPSRME